MITAPTRVLWPSCDVILPIVIVKLLRVLLEPTLLVTSSLRLVGIVADSSTLVAGSSTISISSITIVVASVSWSLEPDTLQIYALSQGMTASTVLACLWHGILRTSSVLGVRPWYPLELLSLRLTPVFVLATRSELSPYGRLLPP